MRKIKLDLVKSTKKVFNECAPIYLKEDKHWGCDLDIISEYVEKFKETEILELGTGHAWHLANLFFVTSANLKRITGIDYSANMLKQAKQLLSSIYYNGHPLIERIDLRKEDIMALPFESEEFDVAFLLNNTLGNIPAKTFEDAKEQRKNALKGIKKIIRKSGYLILSVYNANKLLEEDKYGEVFELDPDLSALETFDLVVRFKGNNTPCYSHWFNKDETERLLYEASFRIVEVEERKKRLVVVAQKKK